jgi:NAD(P) transhydrogenase
MIRPTQNKALVEQLAQTPNANVIAMDAIPRISRAQAFDVLSSMANVSGYKAVVEAANEFGRFFAGQITAAGKVAPAKVLVIGGGVAGLAAVQAARNLGAIVRAFDTRPAVKEQVESLGGEFLVMPGFELEEGSGGYAKAMSAEFLEAEMALFAKQAKEVDIIITTALIPGKPAPKLITKAMLDSMKDGSVVVDLAAEAGGNTEGCVMDAKTVLTGPQGNNVTVLGYTDLPSRLPTQSSSLYANNVANLLLSLKKDPGHFILNMEDEVVRGSIVLKDGTVTWPPPPPAPPAPKAAAAAAEEVVIAPPPDPAAENWKSGVRSAAVSTVTLGALGASGYIAPDQAFSNMVSTFGLSVIVGYHVVWGVKPALHSPLMSVTNAISGMTALGGIVLMGGGYLPSTTSQYLAVGAVGLSAINIAGGFLITQRMLDMFKREGDPPEYNYLWAIPGGAVTGGYLAALAQGTYPATLHDGILLVSGISAIGAIAALSSQTTARAGNALGILAMTTGITGTLGMMAPSHEVGMQIAAALGIGGVIGTTIAKRMQVTDLPQLVAAFHSFVGAAAAMTAVGEYMHTGTELDNISKTAIFLATSIGGMTFSGSLIAFGKLHGMMSSAPLALPGRDFLNIAMVAGNVGAMGVFLTTDDAAMGLTMLGATTALSCTLSAHMTASIGGADMPVVVTVLNSYSGWALCAEGFMLNNSLLTVVGALIGSSGAILSHVMCVAMNRSLPAVLLGGFGQGAGGAAQEVTGTATQTNVEELAETLVNSKSVMIVPGYGLAVAKAQYAVADLIKDLQSKGIKVKVVVHPVAGRMPGQLNVLLAEAGVSYDIVEEMEEGNPELESGSVDTCLVIGANDTINSAAETDPNCAIAGMPVIKAWLAKNVVIFKRSLATGYADVGNPVFFNEVRLVFFLVFFNFLLNFLLFFF